MAAFQTAACNIKHRLQGQKIHNTDDKVILKGKKAVISEIHKYFVNIVKYVHLSSVEFSRHLPQQADLIYCLSRWWHN